MSRVRASTKTTASQSQSTTTQVEYSAEQCQHPSYDRFIRIDEVLHCVGISSTTLYKWMADGLFPTQIKIGRTSFWSENDIFMWMDEQKAEHL
jgi:prophage regulatory protein